MWTGKSRMARVATAALLATALVSCASPTRPERITGENGVHPEAAWWYNLEVEPRSGVVRGIPIGEFDPGWVAASILEEEELARHQVTDGIAVYRNSGLSFAVTRDLDRDGNGEEVFVGTYETRSGTRGRFLAVSNEGRLLRHFVHPGSAGFSALLPVRDAVRWYKCLECGEYELLRWNGDAYALE